MQIYANIISSFPIYSVKSKGSHGKPNYQRMERVTDVLDVTTVNVVF